MKIEDMTILRIRFFENEKCKHFLQMSNFSYLKSQGHLVRVFWVEITILDVRNMFGTRCSEHVRNMEPLEPCSRPIKHSFIRGTSLGAVPCDLETAFTLRDVLMLAACFCLVRISLYIAFLMYLHTCHQSSGGSLTNRLPKTASGKKKLPPGSRALHPGFPGSRTLDPGRWIQDPGSMTLDPGS